jgi:hypothetical protein
MIDKVEFSEHLREIGLEVGYTAMFIYIYLEWMDKSHKISKRIKTVDYK